MLNDEFFIDLFDKIRVVNIDAGVEIMFKARFIHKSDKNYPKDAFRNHAENVPAMKRNEADLNYLPLELYTIEDNDEISDNPASAQPIPSSINLSCSES